jgi:hypothetical protein
VGPLVLFPYAAVTAIWPPEYGVAPAQSPNPTVNCWVLPSVYVIVPVPECDPLALMPRNPSVVPVPVTLNA